MPAGDGTGPLGSGPIGWGLGPCGAGLGRGRGAYPFGAWGYGGAYGRGPGLARRRGARPGFGRGYRWFWQRPAAYAWPGYFAAPGTPGFGPAGVAGDPAPEREWLSGLAEDLQTRLEQIEARLEELSEGKAGE